MLYNSEKRTNIPLVKVRLGLTFIKEDFNQCQCFERRLPLNFPR